MRIHYATWGTKPVNDGYSLVDNDADLSDIKEAVIKSINRKMRGGNYILTTKNEGISSDGSLHFSGAVGHTSSSGDGSTITGEIWWSIKFTAYLRRKLW